MAFKNFISALTASLAILLLAASPLTLRAEPGAPSVDRLNVPGPIRFDNTDFHLAWSVKNQPAYYKQEYIPRNESVENYRSMLLLEAIASSQVTLKDAVAAQVRTINERKKSDPVANMAIMAKNGSDEIILDFVMQARSPKGELITEWNAYRYKALDAPSTGVVLFAISRRAYGEEEAMAFLKALKEMRSKDLKTLAASDFPAVSVGNMKK